MTDIIGWDELATWTEADTERVLQHLREHAKPKPAQAEGAEPARDPDQGPRGLEPGPRVPVIFLYCEVSHD